MIVLAIETSCDDTSISLMRAAGKKRPRFKILSNMVSSQVKIHKKWGGVYPALAKREHQRLLPIVLKKAIRQAKNPKIDLLAVTAGPGLEPCLWVGVNFAKDLAKKLKLPIVPINHVEAHIFANFIKEQRTKNKEQLFPAICLVVSGGHTQLILMKNHGDYKVIGETRDDAAGECLDKTARILGLGYPGGPAIAAEAAKYKIQNTKYPEATPSGCDGAGKIQLPRPMIYQKNYDFSFSGLKTAVLYDFKNRVPAVQKSKEYIRLMAFEIQQAIIDVLIAKTIRAAREFEAKSVILGGGVAANKELRKKLKQKIQKEIPNTKYLIPDIKYCTDNAVMVAAAAYFRSLKREEYELKSIEADSGLVLK